MQRGWGMQVLLVSLAILSAASSAAARDASPPQFGAVRDVGSAGLCRRIGTAGCKRPLKRLCRRTCATAASGSPLPSSNPARGGSLPASRVLIPASLQPSNPSHSSRKLRAVKKAPTKAPSKAPTKAPTKAPQVLARAGTPIVANPSPLYTYTAQLHNAYRQRHQKTPDVVYDAGLEATAQAWANKCIWAHSGTPNVGENLYEMFYWTDGALPSIPDNFAAGLAYWYDEIKLYKYAAPGFSEATGHFTQVVWAGSTRVGCAVSTCAQGLVMNSHIFVCQYAPAGNVNTPAYFKANVLPLKTASG